MADHHHPPAQDDALPVAEFWSFPTDPADFPHDDRISFSRLERKHMAVQEDGAEYEFDPALRRWMPIVDDALIESHQAAYGGGEQDEEAAAPQTAAPRKGGRKRNAGGEPLDGAKRPPRENRAIYVTGLPADATREEVAELFSRKCGVIAENIDDNQPRVRIYTDADGRFKGDALIVFFRPQSVDMAMMLLDDTDFRFSASGLTSGKMRVQAADASYKRHNHDEQDEAATAAVAGGGGAARGAAGEGGAAGNGAGGADDQNDGAAAPAAAAATTLMRNLADKAKMIKKAQKMSAKLADWDDDDPYPHLTAATAAASAPPPANKKAERSVVLRHMFTRAELDEDPAALLEIKEDVRDECEKLGEVTNVVLYDLEPDGVVSVRFRKPEAARACIQLMHGRSFDGRTVQAMLATGKEKYRRSRDKDDGADEDEA